MEWYHASEGYGVWLWGGGGMILLGHGVGRHGASMRIPAGRWWPSAPSVSSPMQDMLPWVTLGGRGGGVAGCGSQVAGGRGVASSKVHGLGEAVVDNPTPPLSLHGKGHPLWHLWGTASPRSFATCAQD